MTALPKLEELAYRSYLSQNPQPTPGSFECRVVQNVSSVLVEKMLEVNPNLKQILNTPNEQNVTNWYIINLKRMSEQGCRVDQTKSSAYIAKEILEINDRAAQLHQAVSMNDLAVVQDLLAQGQLYANVRGRCIQSAAEMRNFEMVQVLAESGPVPDKDRIFVLKLAIHHHHEGAFDALLPNSMSEKDRCDLLLLAIQCSNFTAMSRLLALVPPISTRNIEGLINAAAVMNKPQALEILLTSHSISDLLRKRMASLAERKGFMQIMEILLGKSGHSVDKSMRMSQ